MKSMDPPRLRTLRGLPSGLADALLSSADPILGPEELRDLERRVLSASVGVAAIGGTALGGHGGKLTAILKLLTAKLGILVFPAMTGAALGVGALEAAHLLQEATSHSTSSARPATIDGPVAPRAPSHALSRPSVESFAATGGAPEAPLPVASVGVPTRLTRAHPGATAPPFELDNDSEAPPLVALADLSELDLIERAHSAMVNDPVRAQSWLKEHERRFPSGTYVQEREAIAIEALCRQGDLAGARARAARFFVRFPSSTYRERIESMVRMNGSHKENR